MTNIRKRGADQYQVRIRIKGVPEVHKTFKTKQEAAAWAFEKEQQVIQGLGKSLKEASRLSLSEALARYAREVSSTKKGYLQEYKRIKAWQRHSLSNAFLADIRGADIASYRDARTASGASGNTVRLDLALISHLYEVARKDWGLESLSNPVKICRKPKISRGRDRRLMLGEEKTILDYCGKVGNRFLGLAIILAIETAMRRGELVRGLKWEDVDLERRMAYLQETKNGESRTIPLSSKAVAALREHKGNSESFIIDICPDAITREFAEVCRRCFIRNLRFHDLRHEATSRLFERGFNMMEVSTITGHKSLAMLKRYTHLRPVDLLSRLG